MRCPLRPPPRPPAAICGADRVRAHGGAAAGCARCRGPAEQAGQQGHNAPLFCGHGRQRGRGALPAGARCAPRDPQQASRGAMPVCSQPLDSPPHLPWAQLGALLRWLGGADACSLRLVPTRARCHQPALVSSSAAALGRLRSTWHLRGGCPPSSACCSRRGQRA